MRNLLILDGKLIVPKFTLHQAQGRDFARGSDEHGEFVACKLDNQSGSQLHGWFLLVSPEDEAIMRKHIWCGNICGKPKRYILVRRREQTAKGEHDVLLNHEIWKRMTGTDEGRLYMSGHPLDFRRPNIHSVAGRAQHACCRGVTFNDRSWQVQIYVRKTLTYIGRAPDQEEGFRVYNRYLRELKMQFPSDPVIQNMPFNEIQPQF